MKDVIFINSHPIQYFAPLYKYINQQGLICKVWYGSGNEESNNLDKEFGVTVNWDIPLLDGYEYQFFKNFSWKTRQEGGFFSLINLGMIRKLFIIPKSIIIVHGWHYLTNLLIILLAHFAGHVVCVRCDNPQNQEDLKVGTKQKLKGILLKNLLFPNIDYFLYVGKQNKLFYINYKVEVNKLVFLPHSVDNARFSREHDSLLVGRDERRNKLGIKTEEKVIIFSGKYISKKKPLEVIKAFRQLNNSDAWLILIGEGALRPQMEAYIAKHQIKKVILTGFINQATISQYYSIGDLFVMYSGIGETWGLSVNEAMNFNLPVVVSNLTGCADDLVMNGVNGFVAESDNVADLTDKIKKVLASDKLLHENASAKIIAEYSYETIVENLKKTFYQHN